MLEDLTFIIPTKNRSEKLHQLFQYLSNEQFAGDLLILSCDSSFGDDYSLCHRFRDLLNVRCKNAKNLWPHFAVNKFMGLIRTEYSSMIGDDDYPVLNTIEIMLEKMKAENVSISAGKIMIFRREGCPLLYGYSDFWDRATSCHLGMERFKDYKVGLFAVLETSSFKDKFGILSPLHQYNGGPFRTIFDEVLVNSVYCQERKFFYADDIWLFRETHSARNVLPPQFSDSISINGLDTTDYVHNFCQEALSIEVDRLLLHNFITSAGQSVKSSTVFSFFNKVKFYIFGCLRHLSWMYRSKIYRKILLKRW